MRGIVDRLLTWAGDMNTDDGERAILTAAAHEIQRLTLDIQEAGRLSQIRASAILRLDPTFDFHRALWTHERPQTP